MDTPLVACEGLLKIYKIPEADVEVVALQGLDLEVRQGEQLAIVGQSGSGKSTLLNILGGLDLPTAGRCLVGGYDLTRMTESQYDGYRRSIVGHVWQQTGRNLLSDLTIAENVALPLLLAGNGSARRTKIARSLIARVGLEGMADKFPHQLSGGEQQRAAIAVALVNQPRLLLADEPTGELDSSTAQEVLALLRELNRDSGLTTIVVTHDPLVAAQADRTVAIRDGRTSTETVRRRHPNQASAADGTDTSFAHDARGASTDTVILDKSGLMQLPEEVMASISYHGRATLLVAADHVELWPVDSDVSGAEHGLTRLTAWPPDRAHQERVLIDRAGRLQLPEVALERIPFGGRARVLLVADHVQLWPTGKAVTDQPDGGEEENRWQS